MASTFRRRPFSPTDASDNATGTFQRFTARPTPLQLPGTKVWTSGCALVSTGLREFDAVILASQGASCGGQPVGSCIYIESDEWSILSDDLVRYWCAEALSHDQALLIPVHEESSSTEANDRIPLSSWSESGRSAILDTSFNGSASFFVSERSVQELVLDRLPRNLHLDRGNDGTGLTEQKNALDTLTEEDEQEANEGSDDGLVVAWQYRKDIQEERLGLVSKPSALRSSTPNNSKGPVFCCSYDLQGRLADQINVNDSTIMLPMRHGKNTSSQRDHRNCGYSYYRQLVQSVQTKLQAKQGVVRVLLYHADASILVVALPMFLSYIRQHKLPVVVLVTTRRPTTGSGAQRTFLQLEHCADVTVSWESFAARRHYPPPAEFHKLHGLMAIKRAATCTLASSTGHFADLTVEKRPAATLYGLRRDTRKLHLSLLHIPPEDYATDGSSVGTTAVRSGGGRPPTSSGGTSCSASGGGNSPLDF